MTSITTTKTTTVKRPEAMKVAELRTELEAAGLPVPSGWNKARLAEAVTEVRAKVAQHQAAIAGAGSVDELVGALQAAADEVGAPEPTPAPAPKAPKAPAAPKAPELVDADGKLTRAGKQAVGSVLHLLANLLMETWDDRDLATKTGVSRSLAAEAISNWMGYVPRSKDTAAL